MALAGFAEVVRIRAFIVPYLAETQSTVGDQLARIALSVLVFQRTGSDAATALTYAATFLPAIAGGWLLGGLGDRFSRRAVMVGCDLVRAGLFAAMAVSGLPLAVTIALLAVAVLLGPAFSAAEVSYLSTQLEPEQFRVGTGLRLLTSQLAQVGGFAIGGALVAGLHPRPVLLLDAATYLVSAALLLLVLRPDRPVRPGPTLGPAPSVASSASSSAAPATRSAGARLLWREPRLRILVGASWLAGFFVVPEGLAVPFGRDVDATTFQTGLLFASIPLGGALGALILLRVVRPQRRERVALMMAAGAGLPLLISAAEPHWSVAFAAWGLSGALAAYQIEATTLIAQGLPIASRAQLLGVVSAGLIGAQGLGVSLFGGLADVLGAGGAIALAGGCGSTLGLALCLFGRQAEPAPETTKAPSR